MSVADHLPPYVTERLPTDGSMGALRRKRPALYWLTISVGGTAFVGVLLGLFYTLALFPLIAGQAIAAVLSNDPVHAAAWVVLMAAVGVLFVAVVFLTGRWVGEFAGGVVSEE